MLSNYIKIAWRHLTKHKIYSAITISGLEGSHLSQGQLCALNRQNLWW